MPNEHAYRMERDKFYDLLNDILNKIGYQREIMVLLDLNVSAVRSNNSMVFGRYGEETASTKGQQLIEKCEQPHLKILYKYIFHTLTKCSKITMYHRTGKN